MLRVLTLWDIYAASQAGGKGGAGSNAFRQKLIGVFVRMLSVICVLSALVMTFENVGDPPSGSSDNLIEAGLKNRATDFSSPGGGGGASVGSGLGGIVAVHRGVKP